MPIAKTDIPTKIDVPGAVARQQVNFGDASDYGSLAAEYFSLGEGTDIAPLLKGLDDDACHAPHWGFVVSGEVVVTYTDGPEETCVGDDLFYWPPAQRAGGEGCRSDPLQPPGPNTAQSWITCSRRWRAKRSQRPASYANAISGSM